MTNEKLTRYHVRGELRITGFGHGPISEPESAQMYMASEVDVEIERLRAIIAGCPECAEVERNPPAGSVHEPK